MIITADSILITADAIDVTADGLYQEPAVAYVTKGGIPKAKSHIKRSQLPDIEKFVRKQFDILDGTYVEEIVEEIREEVLPQIQRIDFTQYDLAIKQVNDLLLQAKIKAAEYEVKLKEAEEDDEEALLMLL